jgi:hypothetical protein
LSESGSHEEEHSEAFNELQKSKERYAAHAETAKELARIELQLKDLNRNLLNLISTIKNVASFIGMRR